MRLKFAVVASTALVLAALLGVGVALLTTHRPATVRATATTSHVSSTATSTDPRLYFATPEAAMRPTFD